MHKLFQVHKLNDQGMSKAIELATQFNHLHETLVHLTVGDKSRIGKREFDLMENHLELASFYAKKLMAMQSENQEDSNAATA
jgi:hypothetical protein